MHLSLRTQRLKLRKWHEADLHEFGELHGDACVMRDLGGPISRSASKRKLNEFLETWEVHKIGRWCVIDHEGQFLGYVGISKESDDHPIGEHYEIGWRLHRKAWGRGYAVEAATAAIRDGFFRFQLTELLVYTACDNLQSQSVIAKLPFVRAPSLDFSVPWAPLGKWHGLVWKTNQKLASRLF